MAGLKFPMSADAFFQVVAEQRAIHFEEFRGKAINLKDHQEYIQEFDDKCQAIVMKYQNYNDKTSLAFCQGMLHELCMTINAKTAEGGYHVTGGFTALKQDVDTLEAKYKAMKGELEVGPSFHEAWGIFWEMKVRFE